ncbi:hypothetical protein BJ165DRAFT_1457058 [Panaeolus papilionaceus]|nr:hypothetical protein BJ165DRAFT_1457058 [Panaeolus papilionaceus]
MCSVSLPPMLHANVHPISCVDRLICMLQLELCMCSIMTTLTMIQIKFYRCFFQ